MGAISASSTAALASVLFQRQSHLSRRFSRLPASKVVEDVTCDVASIALTDDQVLVGPPMQIGAIVPSDAVNLQEWLAELARVLSQAVLTELTCVLRFSKRSLTRTTQLQRFAQTGFRMLFRNIVHGSLNAMQRNRKLGAHRSTGTRKPYLYSEQEESSSGRVPTTATVTMRMPWWIHKERIRRSG